MIGFNDYLNVNDGIYNPEDQYKRKSFFGG